MAVRGRERAKERMKTCRIEVETALDGKIAKSAFCESENA